MSSHRYPALLFIIVLAFWVWSGIRPLDTRLTWVLETFPVMIAMPVILLTYRRFRLTDLAYTLIAVHALVLMLGGHYSYAKVPLGFWMEDWFGWTRNNYDKIGHFMQGFVPAICVREVMARTSSLKPGKWLAVVSIAIPLAFSALYEIIEWLASLSNPTDTEAFLGTQGYIWDTQTDMFWCLIGSVAALILLARLHNKYLTSRTAAVFDRERAERFMRRAIELGRTGAEAGDGGPFGAVIVKDGEIIGEGWNRVFATDDPTAHGEVVAIRDACTRTNTFSLEGCEIYTSGEPCPMCLSAIYWARIERVFYGFTIHDAAQVGFDDLFIFEQLVKSPDRRTIPEIQVLGPEALKVLKAYAADPHRVKY